MDNDFDTVIWKIINEKHFLFSTDFIRELAKELLEEDISEGSIKKKVQELKNQKTVYRKIDGYIKRGKIEQFPKEKIRSNAPVLYYLPECKKEAINYYLKK